MRIEEVISSIYASGWVRLEEVRRTPTGLDLSFGIHKGRRGKRIAAWRFSCLEVHEAKISDWDGGGLALYSSTHPAAREWFAPQAQVRWSGTSDEGALIGALFKAHKEAVDDWIPFESYSSIKATAKDKFGCRGPDFLMRAYAKALRSVGKRPQLILGRRRSRNARRPRVLHFGDSYVVANTFVAVRCDENGKSKPTR